MVHVRSLAGDIEVAHDAHVCDVLAQLQEGGGTKKQRFRLVHQGKVLNGGGLAEAGVGPAGAMPFISYMMIETCDCCPVVNQRHVRWLYVSAESTIT
jgi:hypothetical protein